MKLSILGSTGSIGTQALDVAAHNGYSVCALAAGRNEKLAEQQARKFRPRMVAMYDQRAAAGLRVSLADTDVQVLSGPEGVLEAASAAEADVVLNAVVGIAGLAPTMAAIEAKKTLALANKESLVTGGELVMKAVKQNNVTLLPVDSEHSAIFQSLAGCRDRKEIERILLTASGGPFFGKSRAELERMTRADALRHPNWDMGPKITIDSATMMNKGLELIEAVWLFDVRPEDVEIVVHRESILHSAVSFVDGSVIGQMGCPDMRVPIQFALTWPSHTPGPVPQLDLTKVGKLSFFEPDYENFPAPLLARRAFEMGGSSPVVLNGANEAAVELFLQERIGFLRITELVTEALDIIKSAQLHSITDVTEADRQARAFVRERV